MCLQLIFGNGIGFVGAMFVAVLIGVFFVDGKKKNTIHYAEKVVSPCPTCKCHLAKIVNDQIVHYCQKNVVLKEGTSCNLYEYIGTCGRCAYWNDIGAGWYGCICTSGVFFRNRTAYHQRCDHFREYHFFPF